MLLRTVDDGTLAITQTTHAWISGQMARAWGNDRFGRAEPYEAVCLAAEQHDIGWTAWEPEPSWNPETGLPHSFLELPAALHLSRIWSQAGNLALLTSRYAALLVSLHGTNLYSRFRGDPSAADGLAQRFLEEQDAFQARLIDSLGSDPLYAAHVSDDVISRNQQLVALWDRLSLNLCWGLNRPLTIENVPLAHGFGSLTVLPAAGSEETITVEPWPFAPPQVDLIFDARMLTRRYTSQDDLLRGLADAPWRSISLRLRPA